MQPKSYRVFKWVVYALATMLLCALQAMFFSNIRILGLTPFLYPMLPAAVAMFEGTRRGAVFALIFGVLCDLLLPAPFRGFFAIIFPVIAALSGGEVWGYAVVEYTEKPASPYTLPMGYYHVAELGVDEHRRRQGVARALMDFMKEDAVRRGFPRIELDLWEFNRDALRFYEAAGFSTYRRHMELWLEEEKS